MPDAPTPPDVEARELHGRNCAGRSGGDCTCGLEYRIRWQNEQALHAVWRKRAEEAEQREEAALRREAALLTENERLKAMLAGTVEAHKDRVDGIQTLQSALRTLLGAYERCEGNRGTFSCTEEHDCRCPKSRSPDGRGWHPDAWRCECGREALNAAIERATALLAPGGPRTEAET